MPDEDRAVIAAINSPTQGEMETPLVPIGPDIHARMAAYLDDMEMSPATTVRPSTTSTTSESTPLVDKLMWDDMTSTTRCPPLTPLSPGRDILEEGESMVEISPPAGAEGLGIRCFIMRSPVSPGDLPDLAQLMSDTSSMGETPSSTMRRLGICTARTPESGTIMIKCLTTLMT